jgi:hypothetical protein
VRKLALVLVDSLRTDMLLGACAAGDAPHFAELLKRGRLIGDCVSTFPSVTPVASSEIATGVGPDRHWISGMNWYHRVERRYVEYGTSWEATRAFGLFRTLYDIVYNMNMSHLSDEVETIFERLGDAGVRTACTPFLIYRGRTRHGLGLEGLLRRAAVAARFDQAVWGPDELFFGELYASQKVPCKPTLARPGTRDEYSGCVARELFERDLYDFILFSLPDHDFHSHRLGPGSSLDSFANADRALGLFIDAAGGVDAFLDEHAVIVLADHAQTEVSEALPLADALAAEWRVLQPNDERPEQAELAVSPTSRAAGVYALVDADRRTRVRTKLRRTLSELDGVELVCWLCRGGGDSPELDGVSELPQDVEAVVSTATAELRFRPGSQLVDRRGNRWDVDGDVDALAATTADGSFDSDVYPNALERLWSAMSAPHAPDFLLSAGRGYEFVDWGEMTHVPGGSHGALDRGDSLAPLLLVGLDDGSIPEREQWALRDVAGLVLDHFGVPRADPDATARLPAAAPPTLERRAAA